MTAQQQAGADQHQQAFGRRALLAGSKPGKRRQAEHGEQGPAKDDHHGGGQRQFAEDTGQTESQGSDMQAEQGLARGHGHSRRGETARGE
ncbi:hypothetical protein D3C77_711160 [compost metagenome]